LNLGRSKEARDPDELQDRFGLLRANGEVAIDQVERDVVCLSVQAELFRHLHHPVGEE
jgi:hypothetical protein